MDLDYGLLGGRSEWDYLDRVSVRMLDGRWMSDGNLERERARPEVVLWGQALSLNVEMYDV